MGVTTEEILQAIQKAKIALSTEQVIEKAPQLNENELADMIDHTILRPDATEEEILNVCQEAKQHHFYSVCVNSYYVPLVARALKATKVKITSVVGFPLGAMSTAAKAFEARDAVQSGADEIDMVINIGALKTGKHEVVLNDIREVVQASAPGTVKVIIETFLLNDEEKITACVLSKMAGAHFVKTSTGFNGGGATPDDVRLMRRVVGSEMGIEMGVKASGGVRTQEDALKMVKAGASRIGARGGIAIVTGEAVQGSKSY